MIKIYIYFANGQFGLSCHQPQASSAPEAAYQSTDTEGISHGNCLDHTIVPAHDHVESAKFFARIFGLTYEGPMAHFAPVRVNETLVLDFDTWPAFESHHYAFKVSGPEFDAIFRRVNDEALCYGSGPRTPDNMQIYRRRDERGFYFKDPNGHLLEVLTA